MKKAEDELNQLRELATKVNGLEKENDALTEENEGLKEKLDKLNDDYKEIRELAQQYKDERVFFFQ